MSLEFEGSSSQTFWTEKKKKKKKKRRRREYTVGKTEWRGHVETCSTQQSEQFLLTQAAWLDNSGLSEHVSDKKVVLIK